MAAYLNDALHEVLLGNGLLARDGLLEDTRQHNLAVHAEIEVLKLREADQVCADEDTQFPTLTFSPLSVSTWTLKMHHLMSRV